MVETTEMREEGSEHEEPGRRLSDVLRSAIRMLEIHRKALERLAE